MSAFGLFGTTDEYSYFSTTFGAKRNNFVSLAVVHAADDNPFHPV
jgi:hypothetical protein